MIASVFLPATAHAQYEDYRGYLEPPAKVQPFSIRQLPAWITFDTQLRGRSEGQTSINYLSGNGQGYELTRAWGDMEVNPISWLTGYAQFMDMHALALPEKYTAANMTDNFDLRQGYLQLHTNLASLTAGRQELKFGDERLVGISDWSNTSRTFDAIDARFGDKNKVDIFTSSVVPVYPSSFDRWTGGLNFHGAYGVITTLAPHTAIEPYVFVRATPRVRSQQGISGTETEFTPGLHALGTLPHGFDYIGNVALQRGSYSNDSIHAGAGYLKVGYTLEHIRWQPHLLGQYDYATGNPHRNPQRVSTFDQLYPSDHNVFGLVDLLGWQNIQQERLNVDLSPTRNLGVLVQQEWLQVANRKDGIYNTTGTEFVMPSAAGFGGDSLARDFDASGKYVFYDYWVVEAGVGHFSPLTAMKENTHGAPLTLAYLQLTYRFKLRQK
jgi:hypothetical protein